MAFASSSAAGGQSRPVAALVRHRTARWRCDVAPAPPCRPPPRSPTPPQPHRSVAGQQARRPHSRAPAPPRPRSVPPASAALPPSPPPAAGRRAARRDAAGARPCPVRSLHRAADPWEPSYHAHSRRSTKEGLSRACSRDVAERQQSDTIQQLTSQCSLCGAGACGRDQAHVGDPARAFPEVARRGGARRAQGNGNYLGRGTHPCAPPCSA
jgi:hypothetical protein